MYGLFLVAGFFCGLINTIAGSGSLISLPLLIFAGLPANVANGTNRVAILMQSVIGIAGFAKHGRLDFRHGAWLVLPSVVGAVVGAQVAVDLDERLMRLSLAVIMFLMLGLILARPKRWLRGSGVETPPKVTWKEVVSFFAIGFYGGFIQAGVGIFLLASLVLVSGYDLVKANGVKLMLVLAYTPFALAVFVAADQVDWLLGLWLGVGNMVGAWVGARMAVQKGAGFVRWVLVGVVAISALKLMYDAMVTF
ncbi:putative membrane transporter protein [Sulfidibacter corallicola]